MDTKEFQEEEVEEEELLQGALPLRAPAATNVAIQAVLFLLVVFLGSSLRACAQWSTSWTCSSLGSSFPQTVMELRCAHLEIFCVLRVPGICSHSYSTDAVLPEEFFFFKKIGETVFVGKFTPLLPYWLDGAHVSKKSDTLPL